jgi:hypothetical protein
LQSCSFSFYRSSSWPLQMTFVSVRHHRDN